MKDTPTEHSQHSIALFFIETTLLEHRHQDLIVHGHGPQGRRRVFSFLKVATPESLDGSGHLFRDRALQEGLRIDGIKGSNLLDAIPEPYIPINPHLSGRHRSERHHDGADRQQREPRYGG